VGDAFGIALALNMPEVVMEKQTGNDFRTDKDMDEGETVRECVEKETVDPSTNPHVGEDPGLLESTEDPRERRLKRHTM
jgi:hypothetical protein